MGGYAFVFLASGQWAGRRSKCWLRLVRRHPRIWFTWLLGELTRRLTRSELAHCLIAYDGAVLDPHINGSRFWPMDPFVLQYPTLRWVFQVPVRRMDLDRFANPRPIPAWPTVMRWLLGGTVKTRDCCSVVCEALRFGGVDVPNMVVSPDQLKRWLEEQGYEHAALE